jgi:hypothetical protein
MNVGTLDVSGLTKGEKLKEKSQALSEELSPESELGEIFSEPPPKKMVHILVVPPAPGE